MTDTVTDIFFDLDHTLWDFDANSALAFAKVLQDYNIPIHLEEFLSVYKPINSRYWHNYSHNKISATDLKTGRLRETLTQFSKPYHESDLVKMSDSYLEELTKNNQLFDDAIPTLEYLSDKYRMHIITNGFSTEQHIKINRSGLRDFFQTITTSDDAGVKKPDPEIFNKAMSKAQTKAVSAVMIGDNFDADILGAENVGMQTIHYDYHKEDIPDRFKQIDTLSELKTLL